MGLIACILVPPRALAQTATGGELRGVVRDEQGRVVPEVSVFMAGPDVAGERRTTTDVVGFYRFLDLPPGEYAVTASKAGFVPVTLSGVVVRTGRAFTADLTIWLAGVTERVNVSAEPPLIESKVATIGFTISGEQQARLPLSPRRDWADVLAIAPGVTSVEGGYNVRGSAGGSHAMQLDGVDLSATQQSTPGYIAFNTDLLADVQVKTAGVDASSPLGVGAVVSMVSRSGSNRLSGTEVLAGRERDWNSNNNPGGTYAGSSLFQADLSLGGPVRRDRWWFFGAYREQRKNEGISRSPEQIALLRALSPDFTPFDNSSRAGLTFVKITGRLSERHQVYALHQYDRTPTDGNSSWDDRPNFRTSLGGQVAAVGVSSASDSLLTRVVGSYNDKAFHTEALGTGPTRVVHESTRAGALGTLQGTGAIALLGNKESSTVGKSHRLSLAGEATYVRPGWSHELQAGFQVQRRHEETVNELSNGGFLQEQLILRDPADPSAGLIPFFRRTDTPASYPDVLSSSVDAGFYLQDHWRVASRLTLALGVRVDVIRRSDAIFDVPTQRSVEIGPRLGLSYALTEGHQRVLRASWGRVHDALSTNTIRIGEETSGRRLEWDTDLDGVFETAFERPPATQLNDRLVLDPGRSQPYVNEWTLGYGQQLPRRVALDAALVRRDYRNRTAFVETNGIYDGGVFAGYRNPNADQIYLVTGNRWNWHVYTGLELQASRQTGAVQVVAGYTRAFSHTAGTWQPNDPASFIQPDAFPNAGGIGSVRGRVDGGGDSNSLTGLGGSGPQWRDHVVRVAASYSAPWRLRLASVYLFQSGVWSGPVVTSLDALDPRFPQSVRLENGRVVRNPLATLVRFAYPTRAEGQFRLPGVHEWNVRVGRDLPLPGGARAELSLDVFNVLNLGADQVLDTRGAQLDSQSFLKGILRQRPRMAEVAARVSF